VEVQLYSFLIFALDEEDWPIAHLSRLSMKGKPSVSVE
jgi:hypothetical protein